MEHLEKLQIQGATIEYLDPDAFAPKPTFTKTGLKDLALLNCDVSPGILEMILAFPKGLTRFTMKDPWSHPSGAPDGWELDNIIHPYEYIKKIKQSSSASLEYLDLDLWYAGSQPDFDCLDSLKHLRFRSSSAKPIKPIAQPNPTRKWAGLLALPSGPPVGYGPKEKPTAG
ncbi:unnamed protein product [Penicillium palitans]